MNHSIREDESFQREMLAAISPIVRKCVIPIITSVHRDGKPVQCGTGTLLQVADERFLVTAAHVASIQYEHRMPMYVTDLAPGAPGIHLAGRLHFAPDYDIAVWNIGRGVAEKLPNRRFLRTRDFDLHDKRSTPGSFLVFGYPHSRSIIEPPESMDLHMAPISYITELHAGGGENLENFDPELHVLLQMRLDESICLEGEVERSPVCLGGISGSSIWQIHDARKPRSDWSVDDARIVAVQTGVYSKTNAIKGTKWFVVFELLKKNYPDLAGPLSILYPFLAGKGPGGDETSAGDGVLCFRP